MVKELIKGILGKKDPAPAAAAEAGDEPPDELPPLAEDVAAQAAAPDQAAPAEAPAAAPADTASPAPPPLEQPVAEPPAELPPADFEQQAAAVDVSTPQEQAAPAAPTALPDPNAAAQPAAPAQLPDPNAPPAAPDAAAQPAALTKLPTDGHPDDPPEGQLHPAILKAHEVKQQRDTSSETPAQPEKKGVSFFSSILDHVKKNDGFKDKLLSGDLFSRMNNYWELKKEDSPGQPTLSKEQSLEQDMVGTLEELHQLEQKWQVQKLAIAEDLRYLQQREREIKEKTEDLRQLSNELLLFKNVKPDHYFKLHNGVILKNLHDLIDALEIMDDATYGHHVTLDKNDFAAWIENVFSDPKFASKMRHMKTRAEMAQLLQSEPLRMPKKENREANVSPSQYLFLSNEHVIKSVPDLMDSLKSMSHDVFAYHVNSGRNDFADWILETYNDLEMSNALRHCTAKEQMVDVLRVHN